MIEVEVKKGHFGYDLRFSIRDKGALIDFTGHTLVLKVWEDGATSAKWTLTGAIIETGVVDFAVTSDDFTEEGVFFAEAGWTKTGVDDGSETFQITVLPSI